MCLNYGFDSISVPVSVQQQRQQLQHVSLSSSEKPTSNPLVQISPSQRGPDPVVVHSVAWFHAAYNMIAHVSKHSLSSYPCPAFKDVVSPVKAISNVQQGVFLREQSETISTISVNGFLVFNSCFYVWVPTGVFPGLLVS